MHYDEIWLIIPVTPFYLSTECMSCLLHLLDALAFFCPGLPRSGKNIWKIIFFQVREKSGNFVDGQGFVERTWKFREKSGNLKINGYGRQSSENLCILFKRGRMYILMR